MRMPAPRPKQRSYFALDGCFLVGLGLDWPASFWMIPFAPARLPSSLLLAIGSAAEALLPWSF